MSATCPREGAISARKGVEEFSFIAFALIDLPPPLTPSAIQNSENGIYLQTKPVNRIQNGSDFSNTSSSALAHRLASLPVRAGFSDLIKTSAAPGLFLFFLSFDTCSNTLAHRLASLPF
jgi:hypothetical protein